MKIRFLRDWDWNRDQMKFRKGDIIDAEMLPGSWTMENLEDGTAEIFVESQPGGILERLESKLDLILKILSRSSE